MEQIQLTGTLPNIAPGNLAVPAWCRGSRVGHPVDGHPRPADGRPHELEYSRPATGAGRVRDARGKDVEAQSLKRDLQQFGHRQPACRALVAGNYGIGGLIAVAVWSELGDCHRFSRSEQVVRHSGLDVTVDASDQHRAHGHLSRQGPPTLRWALFEAAMNASRAGSPDHAYYTSVKQRHDAKLAANAVARQFARCCYHILRNLDPDVVYAMAV